MGASVHSAVMKHLPPDFAEELAHVLDPADRGAAAGIIKAAIALDDEGLRTFLELFAQRVRESGVPPGGGSVSSFHSPPSRTIVITGCPPGRPACRFGLGCFGLAAIKRCCTAKTRSCAACNVAGARGGSVRPRRTCNAQIASRNGWGTSL